ncbi:phytoene/squalene synthase family protein [Methylocystis echinoides]|uniref:Phytoene synthase n=1 Tax=Methylocystis echinoides TaxID=29468 RepID=A0A9W6GXM9_9HYPH|nr:phytoene/squalene synthase family protein [Methylocystis echinoides]GLI94877.1 phytoene synthase [Methylocystis echinoides]
MHPLSPERSFASAADHAHCAAAIRAGSRSFHLASLALPFRVREPAYGLYAFCRLSDDAVDLGGGSLDAVARLQERLSRACDGRPQDTPEDRAIADVMRDYAIPRVIPEALLDGLAWDAEGRRYETYADLQAYAMRVAGVVGVMMTLMMGVRDALTLARACDLGVAMQLTNIARDVGEDARAGRLYLPLSWLRDVGVDPDAFVRAPVASPAVKHVVARLLGEADVLYARARRGVAHLPASCRPAILAAALLYAEIGRELCRRHALDSVSQRARVSGARKLALLGKAVTLSPWLSRGAPEPALDAASFLIEAVAREPVRGGPARRPGMGVQFVYMLDMFERLERAERFGE